MNSWRAYQSFLPSMPRWHPRPCGQTPDDRVAPYEAATRQCSAFIGGLAIGVVLGIAVFFLWITSANAADKPGERYTVRDRNGRVESTITPDPFVDGRMKIRDRYGRVQGTIDRDGKARDRNGRPVPLTELTKPGAKK